MQQARRIELSTWHRRHSFAHFKALNQPFFSLCVRVDVAPLLARTQGVATPMLSYVHALLQAVNAEPALRQRMVGDEVWEWPSVDISLVAARADESLAFVDLPYATELANFAAHAAPRIAAAQASTPGPLTTAAPRQDVIHATVVPWLHFTSMTHARHLGGDDCIPKFALGRLLRDGAHTWLPVNVEVHHALVDGLHVGRMVQHLEALLLDPPAQA